MCMLHWLEIHYKQSAAVLVLIFPAVFPRNTEELFQALEDNQVILSKMKTSHFIKAFVQEVDNWEEQLNQVLEFIEMVVTVQDRWIYLKVQKINFTMSNGFIIIHGLLIHYSLGFSCCVG